MVSGVREARFPERAAVDELCILSEPLIVVGEQAIRQTAQHLDIEIQLPHLARDGHEVVNADGGHDQDVGVRCLYFVQNTGEIGSAIR